jgi:hypothetical protein
VAVLVALSFVDLRVEGAAESDSVERTVRLAAPVANFVQVGRRGAGRTDVASSQAFRDACLPSGVLVGERA